MSFQYRSIAAFTFFFILTTFPFTVLSAQSEMTIPDKIGIFVATDQGLIELPDYGVKNENDYFSYEYEIQEFDSISGFLVNMPDKEIHKASVSWIDVWQDLRLIYEWNLYKVASSVDSIKRGVWMVNLKDYESAHRGRLAFRISLGDEKRDRIYMAKIKPRPSKDGKGPVYLDLAQLLPPVELRDETIYPESGDTVAFDEPPVLIEAFEPVYPEKAKRAGIGGTVKMILIVDNEGNVWDVHAFTTNKGVDSLLINAAVEAAYKNKYKPAMLKGKPVAACAVYKAVFIPDYF